MASPTDTVSAIDQWNEKATGWLVKTTHTPLKPKALQSFCLGSHEAKADVLFLKLADLSAHRAAREIVRWVVLVRNSVRLISETEGLEAEGVGGTHPCPYTYPSSHGERQVDSLCPRHLDAILNRYWGALEGPPRA